MAPVDSGGPFLVLLADLKRMVTLLPEAELSLMVGWVIDEIQFGRARPKLRVVRTPSMAAPRDVGGEPWEWMGLVRRLLHELDEERVALLSHWCSARVPYASA